jgi:hypothetical protein
MKPPTPTELWGDTNIPDLEQEPNLWTLWRLWLSSIAVLVIFAKQSTIDKINKTILDTIQKANSKEISPKEAVKIISPHNIISQEEWEEISANARSQGKMIGKFYSQPPNKN